MSAEVPSVASGHAALDYVMVASWFRFPMEAAPEDTPFTETNTARSIFRQIRSSNH